MQMKSTGTARWEGASGKVSAASGLFKDATYTAKARFEGGEPYTTPEELVASAHAACFAMAFNVGLSRGGINAKSIDAKAVVEILPAEVGFAITQSTLTCTVEAPGADAAKVREIGEGAKNNCPVSKALKNNVTITLDLNVKT
jgi:osmotically inducible protein OsmC